MRWWWAARSVWAAFLVVLASTEVLSGGVLLTTYSDDKTGISAIAIIKNDIPQPLGSNPDQPVPINVVTNREFSTSNFRDEGVDHPRYFAANLISANESRMYAYFLERFPETCNYYCNPAVDDCMFCNDPLCTYNDCGGYNDTIVYEAGEIPNCYGCDAPNNLGFQMRFVCLEASTTKLEIQFIIMDFVLETDPLVISIYLAINCPGADTVSNSTGGGGGGGGGSGGSGTVAVPPEYGCGPYGRWNGDDCECFTQGFGYNCTGFYGIEEAVEVVQDSLGAIAEGTPIYANLVVCPGPLTLLVDFPDDDKQTPLEEPSTLDQAVFIHVDAPTTFHLTPYLFSDDGTGKGILNRVLDGDSPYERTRIVLSEPGQLAMQPFPRAIIEAPVIGLLDPHDALCRPTCAFNCTTCLEDCPDDNPYCILCPDPCVECDLCPDNCSGHGECIDHDGRLFLYKREAPPRFCACEPGWFGIACEFGCSAVTNVTGYGGVIQDGSGLHMARRWTNCRWRIVSEGTGVALKVKTFDVTETTILRVFREEQQVVNNQIVVVETLLADITQVQTPTVFANDSKTVIVEFLTGDGFVSQGFALVWYALGCPEGSYIDGIGKFGLENLELTPETIANFNVSYKQCEIGYHQPAPDSPECLPCKAGSYTNTMGSATCTSCPTGHYQNETGATTCLPCADGTYADGTGQQTCGFCSGGTYSNILLNGTLKNCGRCDQGWWAPAGSSECQPCPFAFTTTDPDDRADSPASCKCIEGYFVGSNGECVKCPAGADCTEIGTGALYAPAVGYWASEEDPYVILECINEAACLGSQCLAGHTGVLCSECQLGFFKNSTGFCEPCAPGSQLYLPFAIAGIVVALGVSYKLANQNKDDNMVSTLGLGTTFGLWINYIQFASLFGDFGIEWPNGVIYVLKFYSFSRMKVSTFAPGCSVPMPYLTSLFLRNLAPLMYLAWIGTLHVVFPLQGLLVKAVGPWARARWPEIASKVDTEIYFSSHDDVLTKVLNFLQCKTLGVFMHYKPMSWRRSVNATLSVMDLAYIFIISNVFEIFDCKPQDPGEPVSMVAYPAISCYSKEWYALVPFIAFFIFLYIVVLPLVYVHGVWRVQLASGRSLLLPENLWNMYSSIFFRFKRERRYWVLVVIARKLIVSLAIASFSQFPVTQAALAIFTLFVAFWLHYHARPFRINLHNWLEGLFIGINIMLVMLGLVLHINLLTPFAYSFVEAMCLVLTIGGTGAAFLTIAYCIHLLSNQTALSNRLINAKDRADLFAKRRVTYNQATNSFLVCLEIDGHSLNKFMSYASDDDVLRLVETAVALRRLELIQLHDFELKTQGTGPVDDGPVSAAYVVAALDGGGRLDSADGDGDSDGDSGMGGDDQSEGAPVSGARMTVFKAASTGGPRNGPRGSIASTVNGTASLTSGGPGRGVVSPGGSHGGSSGSGAQTASLPSSPKRASVASSASSASSAASKGGRGEGGGGGAKVVSPLPLPASTTVKSPAALRALPPIGGGGGGGGGGGVGGKAPATEEEVNF